MDTSNRNDGFLLIGTLALIFGVLSLATLTLWRIEQTVQPAQHADEQKQLQLFLLLQAQPMRDWLAIQLANPVAATAYLPTQNPDTIQRDPVLLISDADPVVMRSKSSDLPLQQIRFQSTCNRWQLPAEFVPIMAMRGQRQLSWAWAIEDLSLAGMDADATPPFWPTADWRLAPIYQPAQPFPGWLATDHLPRPPLSDPSAAIPFNTADHPHSIPIPIELQLKWGIFAAGPESSREKIVRIRYYLSGKLWNPHEHPIALHTGSGNRNISHLAFWNLPDIRIHNLSQGMRTAWLSLDDAANAATGSSGIHAWLSLPATIAPGEIIEFNEPDARRQPEGLARTLHGGFLVGAADRIEIEFRSREGGVSAAFLPLDSTDPVADAKAGLGWWTINDFAADFPKLHFTRADSPQPGFIVTDGSLGFRETDIQTVLAWQAADAIVSDRFDPRMLVVSAQAAYFSAFELPLLGNQLYRLQIQDLTRADPSDNPQCDFDTGFFLSRQPYPYKTATDALPQNLLQASESTGFAQGVYWGLPNATLINTWLNEPAWWPAQPLYPNAGESGQSDTSLPAPYSMRVVMALNSINAQTWQNWLQPAAPWDFSMPAASTALAKIARHLTEATQSSPLHTVQQFFDQGRLWQALHDTAPPFAAPHPPVKYWIAKTESLRRHGPAIVLHLAARITGPDAQQATSQRSARIWLAEVPQAHTPSWQIVHFETTDPLSHLQ